MLTLYRGMSSPPVQKFAQGPKRHRPRIFVKSFRTAYCIPCHAALGPAPCSCWLGSWPLAGTAQQHKHFLDTGCLSQPRSESTECRLLIAGLRPMVFKPEDNNNQDRAWVRITCIRVSLTREVPGQLPCIIGSACVTVARASAHCA